VIKSRKNEKGRACSTYGDSCVHGFVGNILSERHSLEDVSVGGKVILKWMAKK
jgi:hypothetical protein